jgi:hypothetical protein
MTKIKKLFIIGLSFMLLFALSGCGSSDNDHSYNNYSVTGQINTPTNLKLEDGDVTLYLKNEIDRETNSVTVPKNGEFTFTTKEKSLVVPLSNLENYYFSPAYKTTNNSTNIQFEILDKPVNVLEELSVTRGATNDGVTKKTVNIVKDTVIEWSANADKKMAPPGTVYPNQPAGQVITFRIKDPDNNVVVDTSKNMYEDIGFTFKTKKSGDYTIELEVKLNFDFGLSDGKGTIKIYK